MKKRKYTELSELKECLKKKNCSYKKLSDELGISIDAVNNKLNGYTLLNINEMKRMVMLFDMNPGDINRLFITNETITVKKEKSIN